VPAAVQQIGPYQIIAELGKGGMATVYRALQPALHREVALKVISPAFSHDPTFADRFVREARAGAMVNHPHVVTCYDAGQHRGQFYMALELVTGGDLIKLLEHHRGQLDERLALQLVKDAASGLGAIEAAGLIHRDIKPANIFLSDKGQAKLADLGLVCFNTGDDRMTKPGTIMGTPAYIAPEQARGEADMDIRVDIYSLGATLYHLVTGQPPFVSESPITTLVKAINEPVPDPRQFRTNLSQPVVDIIAHATAKERDKRYQSAKQFEDDLACALAGQALRYARTKNDKKVTPAPRVNPDIAAATKKNPVTPPATPPVAAPSSPAAPSAAPAAIQRPPTPAPLIPTNINAEQLAQVAKRVMMDKNALQAWIILAPGASFPRILLDQIFRFLQITHGINQEATRTSRLPRRLVLAQGDPPSPGIGGLSIRGDRLPPIDEPIIIQITDTDMTAVALTQPGTLITREQLEPVLKKSGIRFGLDVRALHQLVDGPATPHGSIVIARGRTNKTGQCAGFYLVAAVKNTTLNTVATCQHMDHVHPGDVLAHWHDMVPGIAGMTVLGKSLPLPTLLERVPGDCAGEGTEISRDRSGQLVLRATRSGLCQAQENGAVRVIGAVEISGDVTADSPPIVSNEVVLIRGNVCDGAKITSTSDVVILGNVGNASITVGGALEVSGTIEAGDQPIIAGGSVSAEGVRLRHVMAGNLRITGEVRGAQLLTSGDIEIGSVIGGTLTAGGEIHVDSAGDKIGTVTEMWAGHNLSYEQQSKLLKLQTQHLDSERTRMIAEKKRLEKASEDESRRALRLEGAKFVRADAREQMALRQADLAATSREIEKTSEKTRQQLEKQRRLLDEAKQLSDNDNAGIFIKNVAHPGVVIRLADFDADVLTDPRVGYHVGKQKAPSENKT
jgi:serine/threonine protein kinase/uncharacterized protein (DUF342 family)